jgi:regulatory protein
MQLGPPPVAPGLLTDLDGPGAGFRAAMERAGRLLAIRPRTEIEIRSRLAKAGHDDDLIEQAVARLVEMKLIDDLEFAHRWVEERRRTRPRGAVALRAELRAKGVPEEVAEQAIAESAAGEEALATELAAALVPKVAHRPLRDQAARLHARLLRRGFAPDVCDDAVRAVLPPEGWD